MSDLLFERSLFSNALTQAMADFIVSVGIPLGKGTIDGPRPLPGITVQNGKIIVDEEKLTYPGDLLYQAGRLATISRERRLQVVGEVESEKHLFPAEEMSAMAWSWAAMAYLRIPPEVVFHEGGYKGQSMQIIHGFMSGQGMGVPILQLLGMTYEPHIAAQTGLKPFPYMVRWLMD